MSSAELTDAEQAVAMDRWAVLRPHIEEDIPLTTAAKEAGVALRTAQRWLARYRNDGLVGLARRRRSDRGQRRVPDDLVALVEGLALTRPRVTVATIARRAAKVAVAEGWPVPSYSTVYAIVTGVDPHLAVLAHEGVAALRDRYELVYRMEAERPNALWQADHTELDILIINSDGTPARPWLTIVLDDCSRAIAGYTVFLGAPSTLNLSLALRQAIWHKPDPGWAVHGIPDILYTDHGSDFTSNHTRQICVDLHIQLIYSTVARPQGRGKVERIFQTVTTELLAGLPGHLVNGKPAAPALLTLPELDTTLRHWMTATYHQRAHSETGLSPQTAWIADGWIPRMPDSIEQLDALLVMVAKDRVVHRDGIRFQGLRYTTPTLAAYVGEHVTIRYDPRDIGEIRIFHRDKFLCRAISTDHADGPISLHDIQVARQAHRRDLREQLTSRHATVGEYLPTRRPTPPTPDPTTTSTPRPARRELLIYMEDKQ